MSKGSQSKGSQLVLKTSVEADTIRITGTDLITLAISNREDELEIELKKLKEESIALSVIISNTEEQIDDEIQAVAIKSIDTKIKKALDILSSVSDVDFVLSNKVNPFSKNDFTEISKTIQAVAKINGYKKGDARTGSCCYTGFDLPVSFDTPKKALDLSKSLKRHVDRYNEISRRMADISTQLRNVDRMTRKAHASMIRKAISNSPDMQKLIPVLTDKM